MRPAIGVIAAPADLESLTELVLDPDFVDDDDDDEEEGFLEGVDDVLNEPSPPPPPASRSRPCRPPARSLRRLCQPLLLTSGLLRLSRLRWLVLLLTWSQARLLCWLSRLTLPSTPAFDLASVLVCRQRAAVCN